MKKILIFLIIVGIIYFCQRKGYSPNYVFNREPLVSVPYRQLPIGSITPKGWLLNQLKLQRDGLTGHLDEIWEYISNSGWIGGTSESWEVGPYYCDGLVPLAYILKDPVLIEKAKRFIEWTLNSQRDDGFFGPDPDVSGVGKKNYTLRSNKLDWWPRMVMLKVLQSYYGATNDQRVIPFMTKYFKYQLELLPDEPLDTYSYWAKWRGGDNLLMIYWLYNQTGDAFLLDLARLVFEQTEDWTNRFLAGNFPQYQKSDYPESHHAHGVNVAMALKQPAVYYIHSHNPKHLEAVEEGLSYLTENHGQIEGLHSGDELLHGTDPAQGTELCTVVEYMFSMETLLKITGDVKYADILERTALNALPASLKPDIKAHQYFQQPNQVICRWGKHNFIHNSESKVLFTVPPTHRCCAANFHQGWPKLAMHLWLATLDGGLASVCYAPSEVSALVADGAKVTFVEETNYPFDGKIHFIFHSNRKVSFPLHLRIPGWCEQASISINGERFTGGEGGSFVVIRREWKNNDVIEMMIPMNIRTSTWHNNSVGVERGPLVFALKINEEWRKYKEKGEYADWEVYPKSLWNYGLIINKDDPESSFSIIRKPIPFQPFDAENAPILLKCRGKRIKDWKIEKNSAGPLPVSPVKSNEPAEEIILIPYGSAHLRISEFPYIEE